MELLKKAAKKGFRGCIHSTYRRPSRTRSAPQISGVCKLGIAEGEVWRRIVWFGDDMQEEADAEG